MSRPTASACVGLSLGAGVLSLVVALFDRTLRPTLEVVRYAEDIAAASDDIARNVEGLAELERTRELAAVVPEPIVAALRGSKAK